MEDFAETVDELRQLAVEAGMRPYRTFSVVVRWSGGERGRGRPEVVSETEIVPSPVVDLGGTGREITSGGGTTRGEARLSKISPRYTEDDLRALFHRQPLPNDHEGFLEIFVDSRDGQTQRRRFVLKGTPQRKPFEWVAKLRPQDQDRARNRTVQRPTRTVER